MTSPPVTSPVEHWSFQVDSPFRGPAEIRELAAGGSRPAAANVGPADEGVFGEDLAQAEEEFEAYDELEPSSEADAYDEAELAEVSLLEEATASEHPLAAVFSLPRLAFDAMARGGFATAIAIAIGAGLRDLNQLTNMVFWFRHPRMIGQKLRADQRDLAREWLQIRDQVVKPALAGGLPTAPAAPGGASTPAPPAIGKRTSIPSDGLRWFGPPGEETPELMAFMRKVYDLHVKRSKGDFVDTLPKGALDDVVPGKKARKDAAAKAREMLKAAQARLEAEGLKGKERIGVLSAYRSADRQFDIWQGKTTEGKGGFPHYYAKTKATRRNPKYGGEHSDKAAAYLAAYMADCVAAPGYSNHQDGLALDLGTRKGKGRLIKVYEGSWFHDWLKVNANTYHFKPLHSETWHWTYRPPPGATEAEAWSSEVTPAAVRAGKHEVPRISLLASHRGQAPDLVLRWNDMPTMPAEIDVVVHLHGYSQAAMTLPKHIEAWAGLDLGPVDGASGTGRTRPTLTVLPRGHFTGVKVGKIYRYTFPALTTKDGLTTLVRVALERFAQRVGGSPPKLGRLILTAHSGGGAPLMQLLRRHDPQEVHVFDGLYQDPTPLADWASRHIEADRLAVQGGTAPTSAMRVFFGPTTKGFSLCLHRALAADLQDAPASIRDRYRVESSRLGHWQIARQYGWRVLADAAANVPDAARPAPPQRPVKRLFEVDAGEMPFPSEAPFLEAVDATQADEAEAWELGESDTEGEAELDELEAEAVYEEPPAAPELEEAGTEAETEGGAFESGYGETDPEFEDFEAAVDADLSATLGLEREDSEYGEDLDDSDGEATFETDGSR
jgi:D-alanyl-D-alanine carboxypeptidase